MSKILPSLKSQNQGHLKLFYFDSSDMFIYHILTHQKWLPTPKLLSNNTKLHWICCPSNQNYQKLSKDQLINHFKHNYHLTTKIGLMRTLSSNYNNERLHYLSFYPRTYHLSNNLQQFIADFQSTAICNLLKKFIINIEIINPSLLNEVRQFTIMNKIANTYKHLESLISTHSLFMKQNHRIYFDERIFTHLLMYLQTITSLEYSYLAQHVDIQSLVSYSVQDPPYNHQSNNRSILGSPSFQSLCLLIQYYRQIKNTKKGFNSDGVNNMWIVKGNQSSRGRTIHLVNTINQAKYYLNPTRIIQKYIENIWILNDPQLIAKCTPNIPKIYQKKFDIRVWVLVKSFNPLSAYIYKEGYLRISTQPYHLSTNNHYIHLTNYSIQSSQFLNQEDSYLLLSEFQSFLRQTYQHPHLYQDIKHLITTTLKSVQINHNSNEFQLFGFDILLDNNLKPWLLEVNMSPACEERGELERVVKEMGKGLLSLLGLIDDQIYQWQSIQSSSPHHQLKHIHHKDKLVINGNAINIKQYHQLEQQQISYQHLINLQTFFKKKSKPLLNDQQRKIARATVMVSYLAKLIINHRKYFFKIIKRRINKYY